ncbi:rhomboid family intramembrane serine protease [Actinocatenispora thailandica]|nr:rhomboid family intramembrane serine protease [Actinocatenispora thailandica]
MVKYMCAAAVVAPGWLLIQRLVSGSHPIDVLRRLWRRPVPIAALALVVLFTGMAIVQTASPHVLTALERQPGGGWWRCGTALLVQTSGWVQLLFNLAALIVVAPASVRVFGTPRMLVAFVVSGVAAQAVSMYAGWSSTGGGDSVAICGLVGALSVWYLLRRRELARWILLLVPAAGVVLCTVTNNHGVGVLAGCLLGAIYAFPVAGHARDSARVTDHGVVTA